MYSHTLCKLTTLFHVTDVFPLCSLTADAGQHLSTRVGCHGTFVASVPDAVSGLLLQLCLTPCAFFPHSRNKFKT